jgi:hypothetical protein
VHVGAAVSAFKSIYKDRLSTNTQSNKEKFTLVGPVGFPAIPGHCTKIWPNRHGRVLLMFSWTYYYKG